MDWELPRPDNVDVFVERLERAGLLVFDPVVEDLCHEVAVPALARRTAQDRFARAVGISQRKLRTIERARSAAAQLIAGVPIPAVIAHAGYYDQPHLTRSMQEYLGQTPVELAQNARFVDL
jgi:methylphosphotriester-DNA--protein-cysteine methyltransferase